MTKPSPPRFFDEIQALSHQASLFIHLGMDKEAIEFYRKLALLEPQNPTHLIQLACLHYNLKEFEKAIEIIQLNLKRHPSNRDSRLVLGKILLTLGNLKDGFKNIESRIDESSLLWKGEKIDGKTLLVRGEQGLGDIIQFIRYVPLLSRYGCKTLLEIPACLQDLFGHLGVELTSNAFSHPQHDFHVHMLSLPSIFGTELSTIPSPISINNVALRPMKNRIGIVWKGNPNYWRDWRRSLQLTQLAPLFQIQGLEYISLQLNPTQEESKFLNAHGVREQKIISLIDTVRLLESCERVICVDTMIAHLAGSMGIPTWILLPYSSDWRWMLDRADSPWYPSVRLFRQQRLDCWNDPLEEVVQYLGMQK